jgi:hypothetical protein
MRRAIAPHAKNATGGAYPKFAHVCLVCSENAAVNDDNCVIQGYLSGTTNQINHMKSVHGAVWEEANAGAKERAARRDVEIAERRATAAVASAAASAVGKEGGQRQLDFKPSGAFARHTEVFTARQKQRMWTRGVVAAGRPANMCYDKEMRKLHAACSFSPPCPATQLTHRIEFQLQLDRKIIERMKFDGVIGADCKPKYGLPLLSASFDTSSLALKGVKAIAINLHYVDKNMALLATARAAPRSARASTSPACLRRRRRWCQRMSCPSGLTSRRSR